MRSGSIRFLGRLQYGLCWSLIAVPVQDVTITLTDQQRLILQQILQMLVVQSSGVLDYSIAGNALMGF